MVGLGLLVLTIVPGGTGGSTAFLIPGRCFPTAIDLRP